MSRTKSPATVQFETLTATIVEKLSTDPKWIKRAIVALYRKQTADEQATKETGVDNFQGFNKPDARRMTFVAEWLLSGKTLSDQKALEVYGPKLKKYRKQLAKIALAEYPEKAAKHTQQAA